MNLAFRYSGFGAALFLASCAHLQVADFTSQRPSLDPTKFFTGRTTSEGVMENRGGIPMKRVTTSTRGRWEGDTLILEQDLNLGDAKPEHRSWRIQRVDKHHYVATANDMVGSATGEAYGNVFHWQFTLALSPGNPLTNVRMSQWMYLQPGGRTLINHSTIRKFGIVVAQVTEQFRREGREK